MTETKFSHGPYLEAENEHYYNHKSKYFPGVELQYHLELVWDENENLQLHTRKFDYWTNLPQEVAKDFDENDLLDWIEMYEGPLIDEEGLREARKCS